MYTSWDREKYFLTKEIIKWQQTPQSSIVKEIEGQKLLKLYFFT